MDLSPATIWWLLAAVLVALELATGTFYLLMLAAGAAVGALAAHMGFDATAQIAASSVIAGAAVTVWHRMRAKSLPSDVPAGANRDVNLDVGERVNIKRWNDDGTARAYYRGSEWLVRFGGDGTPEPGEHKIISLEGNRLIVTK
jgi:membrane protein implicated in regulation of membrane protease activity